jgi:hypothetical protein
MYGNTPGPWTILQIHISTKGKAHAFYGVIQYFEPDESETLYPQWYAVVRPSERLGAQGEKEGCLLCRKADGKGIRG